MSPYTLRAWQAEALDLIEASTLTDRPEDSRHGVVRAIMGAGKSVVIGETAARAVARGWRVVVTTPTVSLVDQLAATLGEFVGVEHVGRYYTHAKEIGRPVTVCCHPSAQPYYAADPGPADLWIADECHKTECEKMHDCAEAYPPARRLGFTATPYRADRSESLRLFDNLLFDYGVGDAQRDGVIVPLRVVPWTGPKVLAFDAGVELSAGAVGAGMWSSRRISEAERVAGALTGEGRRAVAIHSRMPRKQAAAALEGLRTGVYSEAVHVSMLAEGIDLPWLRWLVAFRPVSSRVRFAQEVGRILRTAPGKDEAILFDPLGLWEIHDLSYAAILGEVEDTPIPADVRAVLDALDGPRPEAELEALFAVSRRVYSRAIGQLLLSLDEAGAVPEAPTGISRGPWRRDLATDAQRSALVNLSWIFKRLPKLGRQGEALWALYMARNMAPLTKGDASDLITMAIALKQIKTWPEEKTA